MQDENTEGLDGYGISILICITLLMSYIRLSMYTFGTTTRMPHRLCAKFAMIIQGIKLKSV